MDGVDVGKRVTDAAPNMVESQQKQKRQWWRALQNRQHPSPRRYLFQLQSRVAVAENSIGDTCSLIYVGIYGDIIWARDEPRRYNSVVPLQLTKSF